MCYYFYRYLQIYNLKIYYLSIISYLSIPSNLSTYRVESRYTYKYNISNILFTDILLNRFQRTQSLSLSDFGYLARQWIHSFPKFFCCDQFEVVNHSLESICRDDYFEERYQLYQ